MKIPIIGKLLEKRYSLSDIDKTMGLAIAGRRTATGAAVTEATALNSSAVFACVRLLAETTAMVPLITYRRLTPRGKERAFQHPLYTLLHDSPNPEMPAMVFRETLQGHLCTWGNAFAEIDWGPDGYVKALWPLRPDRVRVARQNGEVAYQLKLPSGQTVILPTYRVLHIPGFGFDGLVGYSPVQLARESIGLSLATEEFGARFFGNGANPGGVLRHPHKLSQPAQDNIRESWNEMHSGLSNQHRIAILEEGMDYVKVGIPPDDAQFLETRQFQVTEIARWFHVPPHMIGDLSRSTNNNIEQQSLEFVTYSLGPWLTRWEQYCHLKLLLPAERGMYFVEHLVDALLKGDVQARYNAYSVGRQWGWLSADDVREKENMNPLPEGQGDIYMVPLNMVPASQIGHEPTMQVDENNSLTLEIRRGSMATRQRTIDSYKTLFESAGQAIVKRETDNVRRAAKKHLGTRSVSDFNAWLEEFYHDFPEFISRQIRGPVKSLADVITALAGEEVQSDPDTAKVEVFVGEYLTAFNTRYTSSSKGQLQKIIKEADEDADIEAAINERLSEWEQTRAGKVATNEPHQLANAVTRLVWAAVGIRYLVWRTGGTDNCPYCQELNGKRVGIDQVFSGRGEGVDAEGKTFITKRPTAHPPLHLGCQCGIEPE